MTEFVGLCFHLLWETVRKSTIRRNTQVSDHDLIYGIVRRGGKTVTWL
jgi:hypothetical protein